MNHIKEHATLHDIQSYVADMEVERGFATTCSDIETALQLGEEVGELFKSIRKVEKMRIDKDSIVGTVEEELADVLIFTAALANRYSIDLEKAFREKEKINNNRNWI